MDELKRRPLAFALISFYLLSFALSFLTASFKIASIIIFALSFALLTALAIFKKRVPLLPIGALIAAFLTLASFLSWYSFDYKLSNLEFNDSNTHSIVCVVEKTYYSASYGSSQKAGVISVDGKKASFGMILETNDLAYPVGTELRFSAVMSPLGDVYDGSELRSHLADKILYHAAVTSAEPSYYDKFSLPVLSSKLSSRLSGYLCSAMGYENGGFASAVLLGNKAFLSRETESNFSRIGVAHLLAISGIHLTIMTSYVSAVIKRLTRSKTVGCICTVAVAILYCFVTGFAMSTLRASIMIIISSVGAIISRRADSITSLGIAVSLIVLVNPYAVGSISLLLSFSSILGIALFNSAIKARTDEKMPLRERLLGKITDSVLLTLCVFAVTLPASWLYFDEISLMSPITNLIFIPLVSALLFVLPIQLLLIPATRLFLIVSKAVSAFISLIIALADKVGDLRHITVSTALPIFPFAIAAIVILLIATVIVKPTKRKLCATAILGCIAVIILSAFITRAASASVTSVTMTARKSSDALLVISNNSTMICDISDGSYTILKEALKAMRDETYCDLDALMYTHYHSRHITTFKKLTAEYALKTIYMPEPIGDDDKYVFDTISSLARSAGCEIIVYDRAERSEVDFKGCTVTLEEFGKLKRSTHPVIALTIESDKTFAYLGSSTNDTKYRDLSEAIASADIVCYGIHGPIYKVPLEMISSDIKEVYYNERVRDIEVGYTIHGRQTLDYFEGDPRKVILRH